jgi:hypothetical protein
MYWIYAILFLLAVAAPETIRDDIFGVPEEEAETILIFIFGAVGFLLAFIKEKALLRHVREKLTLQREKTDITKDLSESYSYIGATNRKIELLRNFILSLPLSLSAFRHGETNRAFSAFSKAVRLFCRTDSFVLRVLDTNTGRIVHETKSGKHVSYALFDAKRLLGSDRGVYEEEGCLVVRSPAEEDGLVAYLIFPKSVNDLEDEHMLEVIATEGLLLVSFERAVSNCLQSLSDGKHESEA